MVRKQRNERPAANESSEPHGGAGGHMAQLPVEMASPPQLRCEVFRGGRGRGRGLSTFQTQQGGRGGQGGQQGNQHGRGGPQQLRSMPTQQSGVTRVESTWRGRGGANANGHGGEPSSAGLSRSSIPDLHQATQASYESIHAIQSAPSAGSSSQASYFSESGEETHLQMAQQFQQLTIQTEGTSSQTIQPTNAAVPSSESVRFPLCPGKGNLGSKCMVKANHFLVELTVKDLHQYHVSVTPEVTIVRLNRAVMSELVRSYKHSHLGNLMPAYDGRQSLYTAGPLPFTSKEFVVTLRNEARDAGGSRGERKFNVVIKFAARIDLRQSHLDMRQEAIQALDVVLHQNLTSRYTPLRQSFFSPAFGKPSIGDGLEAWRGFYQSLRPTETGLSLNIDMSAAVFVQPLPVIDFVAQTLNRDVSARVLSVPERQKIKKALKGLKIEVTHRGNMRRKYCISDLTIQPTRELSFPFDDSGTVRYVVQYFQETYGVILTHTWLPCLQVGSKQRPTYLPMEVCKIADGQKYNKRLNKKQTANMLKVNCQHPKDRESYIVQAVRQNAYTQDTYAKEFGIKINENLASVQARILPAPRLKYHETGMEKICQPRMGQWNMRNKKMVNGGIVGSWTCIDFTHNTPIANVHNFCRALANMCCVSGMVFNLEPILPPKKALPGRVDTSLEELHKAAVEKLKALKKDLDLLIAILPNDNGSLYGDLKRKCDTELGLISQCCLEKNVFKMNSQYMANVALKINGKVGGRNMVLEDALLRCIPMVSDKPTIIFGADVTHPKSGEDRSPSIAAVVASQDWPEVTKYISLFSAQAGGKEMIQDLFTEWEDPVRGKMTGGMIKEHLISFYIANGKRKPERIIFYRDGVSEGQFGQVLQYELTAIQKAWVSLEHNNPLPPITFVVVQKHHHTRLFPLNHNDPKQADRTGNIIPGTVVDSKICHPTLFDFYLCSHAGIQGTNRPAHYHVLWDDNRFTADGLQALTHSLCYIYARCTRAVSYVAPAYYAHLAAFRARCYLGYDSSSDESSMEGTSAVDVPVMQLPPLSEKLKKAMFYI